MTNKLGTTDVLVSSNKKVKPSSKTHPCPICGDPKDKRWCYGFWDNPNVYCCKETKYDSPLKDDWEWSDKTDTGGTHYVYKPSNNPDYTYRYKVYEKDEKGFYSRNDEYDLIVKRWNRNPAIGKDRKEFKQFTLVNGKENIGNNVPKELLVGLYYSKLVRRKLTFGQDVLVIGEGESVVDAFKDKEGFFAFTNAGGANKWEIEHTELLMQYVKYRKETYDTNWKETAPYIAIALDWDKPGLERGLKIYDQFKKEYPLDRIVFVAKHIDNLNVLPSSRGVDMADWMQENGFPFETVQEFLDRMTVSIDKIPYEELLGSSIKGENKEKTSKKCSFESLTATLEKLDVDIDTEWLVEGLLAKGSSTIITAKPKVGKTVFTLDLLASVYTEQSFLGKVTKQAKVLSVDRKVLRSLSKGE